MPGLSPSAITGATPAVTGEVDWTDNTDNWRAVDAEWLQSRSVVRIDNDTPATSSNLISGSQQSGRVYYTTTGKKIIVNVGTTTPSYETVLSSGFLVSADETSVVRLGIANFTASGFSFTKSNGAVSIGSLSIGTSLTAAAATVSGDLTARAGSNANGLRATTGGVVIDTTSAGGTTNAVTLTTASTRLNVNKGVTIASGGLTVTAGGATVTAGGLTVTAGGGTVSGGLTVNGGVVVSNTGLTVTAGGVTVTAGGLTVSSGATAMQAATATSVTTPLVQSATGADLTLTAASGQAIRTSSNMFFGNTTVRNAWVVYGADPGVSNVPEGTIWIS